MVTTKTTILIIYIFCISFISSLKINVLPVIPNNFNRYHNMHKFNSLIPKQQLLFPSASNEPLIIDNICTNIIETYHTIGHQSLNSYKECLLTDNSPQNVYNCYEKLSSFYCDYYYSETFSPQCANNELITFVLSVIGNCLKSNTVKTVEVECPGLNFESFKIDNALTYCKGAQKKKRIEEQNDNDNVVYEYTALQDDMIETCLDVVSVYNSCIDADNAVYPGNNYEKCLDFGNEIYKCNKAEKYFFREKDMCKEKVFPKLLGMIFKGEIENVSGESVCVNFHNKLF